MSSSVQNPNCKFDERKIAVIKDEAERCLAYLKYADCFQKEMPAELKSFIEEAKHNLTQAVKFSLEKKEIPAEQISEPAEANTDRVNLFDEREKYEADVSESRQNRRTCYLAVMITANPLNEDPFFRLDVQSLDDLLKKTESDFLISDFDQLIQLFPRAKDFFKPSKFLKQ